MQKKELTNSLRRPDKDRIRRFREFVKEKDAVITQESPEMELSAFMTRRALIITDEMNNHYHTPEELHDLLEELTCREVPAHVGIVPPFSTDFGANIIFEDGVYVNVGVSMQDQGGILIKEGALIGHHTVLATLNHVLDPARRHDLIPKPIVIGKNAWIGANATILQGVTVGDGAVVAAGAVVTSDVPANTVVGGVPARVLRNL